MPKESTESSQWLARYHRTNAMTWGGLVVTLAVTLAISFGVTPEDIQSGRVWLSPSCLSVQIFNHECPTCGMTRGFAALSHGRFYEALGYNRASPIVYALAWLGLGWAAHKGVCSLRRAREAARKRTMQ